MISMSLKIKMQSRVRVEVPAEVTCWAHASNLMNHGLLPACSSAQVN